MIEIEIALLTNNLVKPFQKFHKKYKLNFIQFNKLHVTQCLAEHGLGFLLTVYEINDSGDFEERKQLSKIIFDVGGTNLTYLHNLSVMNLLVNDVDSIVLSHWHYDHIGGLYKVLEAIEHQIPVYTHRYAEFERIFRRSDDVQPSDLRGKSYEEIESFLTQSKIVNQEPIDLDLITQLGGNVKFISEDTNILNLEELKIWASGEIPRIHADEDFSDYFSFQDNGILEEDKILDDKCLILEFQDRIILLNGCCHSGLKNTIDYITSHTAKPFSQIIGGFHMASASKNSLNSTLNHLTDLPKYENRLYLFPIHCTGDKFLRLLQCNQIGSLQAFDLSVGNVFKFKS
ncbi:MAG: putative Metal-dependent hydrolases of the beta-lactamase superfamily II [Promethearchaeota archaeon]|nr:MAG: putative Metal-dependent hydrolases of the beta-lactamase superfamily II [Candidatus Lokiarchaeota archaeon]